MLVTMPNWVVLVSLAVNLTLCSAFLIHYRSSKARIARLEASAAKLEEHLALVSDSGKGVGRKVVSLDRRLKATERKQKDFEATDVQKVSYNEAVRLLSLGAEVDDLIQTCGLSRAEADLIKVLHSSRVSNQARH